MSERQRPMHPDTLSRLWQNYRLTPIDRTIHDRDRMYMMRPNIDEYLAVGESGARTLFSTLSMAKVESVKSALDFGCGHGRVARHMRAMFPTSSLYFLDADPGAAAFCAEQFGGAELQAMNDFSDLELPNDLDLIWLGSIFTHIDAGRMHVLFDKLVSSLSRNGALIVTLHGPFAIKRHENNPLTDPERWKVILDGYNATGCGWARYDGKSGEGDWGLSLTSPSFIRSLTNDRTDVTLTCYMDRGWANFHDVAVWTRN